MTHTVSKVYSYLILLLNINFNGMFNFGYTQMFLGFEDVATKWFAAVESHVHWIYCAYILMNLCPIRGVEKTGSIAQKQEVISHIVSLQKKSRVRQLLSRFNGVDVYKRELQQALAV
jgi:hypothetical protein